MPFKKSYRKKKMTAVTKHKGSRFGQINKYRIKPEPFPRVMYTRCKFGASGALAMSGLSTAVAHTFRINSIYDPDHTGTGNTVQGHSVLQSIYRRYLVTNCKFIVRFFDPGVDQTRVGVKLRIAGQSGVSGLSNDQLLGRQLTYMRGIANSGSQKSNFVFNIKPWTLCGLSKLEYFSNLEKSGADMDNSPNYNALVDIFVISPSTGVTSGITYAIQMIYDVQLYNRKDLPASAF